MSILKNKNLCILDIETTGFEPENSEIIEIFILKVSNSEIIDEFYSLFKPKDQINNSEIHGITDLKVKNAPLFKDKNDMIEKMKNAKPTYLASNEMEFMSNTDAGDILNSDNPIKLAKPHRKRKIVCQIRRNLLFSVPMRLVMMFLLTQLKKVKSSHFLGGFSRLPGVIFDQ